MRCWDGSELGLVVVVVVVVAEDCRIFGREMDVGGGRKSVKGILMREIGRESGKAND